MAETPYQALESLRVDHIGSLARPQALLDMRAKFESGDAAQGELRAAEDRAIREVIARQEAIAFPVVNDGEFRRRNFQDSFGSSVSGFEVAESAAPYQQWLEHSSSIRQERVGSGPEVLGPPVVTRRRTVERLRLVSNLVLEEFRFASTVANSPVKVTLISPDRISQRFDYENSRSVYDGLDDFTNHVGAIEHEMVEQLENAGCRYVQIDAPGYTAYVDPPSIQQMRARGEDPQENMRRSIAADNAVIEGFPEVAFGIHLCRGNSRARDPNTGALVPQWHREGHYDAIAERLFNGLNHRRLLLEYDSDRAGGFEPLRFVPKDKIVVLGLVSTKTEEVESVDFLMRRVEEAARYISVEQLAISPQCGFGSSATDSLPEHIQWRKLEVLLEVAGRIWP